jgi:AAA+ ATPase superfamily predicted ATPase
MSIYEKDGATMPRGAKTYVERAADEELRRFLRERRGSVCSILAPRQMGKSSLIVRTIEQLDSENSLICIRINLQSFGGLKSEKDIWRNILDDICKDGNLLRNLPSNIATSLLDSLKTYWKQNKSLAATNRFESFLTQRILPLLKNQKLVFFLDEIQEFFVWGFQHECLSFIKTLSENPRLTFVLVGVARPSEFGEFNIGKQINLKPLTIDLNLKPLEQGIQQHTEHKGELKTIFTEVINWTGGQPFLTQLVCHEIAIQPKNTLHQGLSWEEYIKDIVNKKIIKDWRNRQTSLNLNAIESYFIGNPIQKDANMVYQLIRRKQKALQIYNEIFKEGTINFRRANQAHWTLLISGLAVRDTTKLKISNLIYANVFNFEWIKYAKEVIEQNLEECMETGKEERDYTLIIDRSPSMNKVDNPLEDDRSRWEIIREATEDFARQMDERDPDGITIHLFSRTYQSFYSQNADDVEGIFDDYRPGGSGTKLGRVLQKAFDDYFERRDKGELKKDGEWILVVTDGKPDSEQEVFKVIANATHKLQERSELGITFLRIGNDKGAEAFLQKVDDWLVKDYGAKLDICDTKSFDDLEDLDFNDLLRDAYKD